MHNNVQGARDKSVRPEWRLLYAHLFRISSYRAPSRGLVSKSYGLRWRLSVRGPTPSLASRQPKIEKYADGDESLCELGVEVCTELCAKLMNRVAGFHVY